MEAVLFWFAACCGGAPLCVIALELNEMKERLRSVTPVSREMVDTVGEKDK
jgi:hypothetical protein